MFEVREVLRLWLRGEGMRSIERLSSAAEAIRPLDRAAKRLAAARAQLIAAVALETLKAG